MKNTHFLNKAITANSQSPFVKLKSINVGDCKWTDGFWAEKAKIAEETMVPYMGSLLKGDKGHAYNNFKVAAGLIPGTAEGMLWHDGDFYKWMEASTYIYAMNKNENILSDLDEIIDVISQAMCADGYLHTHNQILDKPRWETVCDHELYNAGHLITGGVIHHRLTGQDNWLSLSIRCADYLFDVFESKDPELARFGFNPSQIMALVELYRETGIKKYLELADIFVSMRGSVPMDLHKSVPYWFTGDQCQMKTPLREETEAVGHAVTGMYLYSGAADVYAETGEPELLEALTRIWSSATERKMYITGALGQCHHGAYDDQNMIHEGFIDDYLMPNSTAYNETCANISNAMFNWRLLAITGESKHADVIELVLHNSAMVGINIEGDKYFYANPLRMNHGQRDYSDHCDCTESADRESYIECFCCPPNLVRTIAQLSAWAYSLTDNGVAVNLFGANELNTQLMDGSTLKLVQKTQYPWQGHIEFTVQECKSDAFDIQIRIPAWAKNAEVLVNGTSISHSIVPGQYLVIEQSWQKNDVITVNLPMDIQFVEGHPRIEEIRNQVAIKRGPLVYCVETPDLPENTGILDVYLPSDSTLTATHDDNFLGGITTIQSDVLIRTDNTTNMYADVQQPKWQNHAVQFVPYYSWSNRGTAEMSVFVPIVWK